MAAATVLSLEVPVITDKTRAAAVSCRFARGSLERGTPLRGGRCPGVSRRSSARRRRTSGRTCASRECRLAASRRAWLRRSRSRLRSRRTRRRATRRTLDRGAAGSPSRAHPRAGRRLDLALQLVDPLPRDALEGHNTCECHLILLVGLHPRHYRAAPAFDARERARAELLRHVRDGADAPAVALMSTHWSAAGQPTSNHRPSRRPGDAPEPPGTTNSVRFPSTTALVLPSDRINTSWRVPGRNEPVDPVTLLHDCAGASVQHADRSLPTTSTRAPSTTTRCAARIGSDLHLTTQPSRSTTYGAPLGATSAST